MSDRGDGASRMAEEPVDLSALNPDIDANAEARFVSAVMARVDGGSVRYPAAVDPLFGAWMLARPLAIAASLVIIATSALWVRQQQKQPVVRTVAEAVGVPPFFLAPSAAVGTANPSLR